MMRSFESELIKLRRRSMVLGVFLPLLLFSFISIIFQFSVAHDAADVQEMLPDTVILTADSLAEHDGLARALADSAVFGGVVVAAVVAASFASEFSLGTLRNVLVQQPRRTRFLLGKFLGLLDLLFVARLAAIGGSVILAVQVGRLNDIPTGAWFSAQGWETMGLAAMNVLIASAGWAALGTMAAVILRSPAGAVGAVLAYSLPVEGLIVAYWDAAPRWLPGQIIYAVGSGGTASTTYARALALMLAYGLFALSLSIVLINRRDVTA